MYSIYIFLSTLSNNCFSRQKSNRKHSIKNIRTFILIKMSKEDIFSNRFTQGSHCFIILRYDFFNITSRIFFGDRLRRDASSASGNLGALLPSRYVLGIFWASCNLLLSIMSLLLKSKKRKSISFITYIIYTFIIIYYLLEITFIIYFIRYMLYMFWFLSKKEFIKEIIF